jgi:transcriptional regulator with XRE-family HTH domain
MERIRQLRQEQGLSQVKLAVMADMDPATLNRLERGTGNPNLKTLQRVATALDVEVTDLLGKAPASSQPNFNGLLEEEQRHTELEEIRESYRDTREGLDRYCDLWEKRIADDDLERQAVLEFMHAAKALLPALRDSVVSEMIEIARVVGAAEDGGISDEMHAEASIEPAADRYHEIGRRLEAVWRQRLAADASRQDTGTVVDFRAFQAEHELRKRRTG